MTRRGETEHPGRGLIARLDADQLAEVGDAVRFECDDALGNATEGVAVRLQEGIVAFENVCPHLGFALDCHSSSFTTDAGDQLECDAHGARFQLEDGACVSGPCEGDQLEVFEVEVDDEAGEILVRRQRNLSL